ncbi:MAG: A24 family peptidase [Planctomycetota bacterium]
MAVLAVVGLIGGQFANYAIYNWCWYPRAISPWAPKPAEAAARSWWDRLPVVGWISLRRESELHGGGFWVRPLLIELSLAAALPLLYLHVCPWGGLLSPADRNPATIAALQNWMNQVYFAQAFLVVLMTAATFIDFDEQTIPDLITIPGTLIAIGLASGTLNVFLPAIPFGAVRAPYLWATFEHPWLPTPKVTQFWTGSVGLRTGLLIWSGWCFALADRRVILRRGLAKAVQYFFAGLTRHWTWRLLLAMWVAGLIAICLIWNVGGLHWWGCLSSLVGLAVGGGSVWAVRIVASSAMRVEAMGFGDVTLMAMIGAFVGWQASLAAFFLAPMAAIVIVIVQYIVTREPRVPFGPYLCAGTMLTIWFWDQVYNVNLAPNLALMGPVMLWLVLTMLALMGVMLFVWRLIKQSLLRG